MIEKTREQQIKEVREATRKWNRSLWDHLREPAEELTLEIELLREAQRDFQQRVDLFHETARPMLDDLVLNSVRGMPRVHYRLKALARTDGVDVDQEVGQDRQTVSEVLAEMLDLLANEGY